MMQGQLNMCRREAIGKFEFAREQVAYPACLLNPNYANGLFEQ
jgi:hypothetical protein